MRGHNKECKRLFTLEIFMADEDDADQEAPEEEIKISLHAITVVDVGETMQIKVRLGHATLTALIDSGIPASLRPACHGRQW